MRVSKPQGDLRSLTWKARTKAARRLLAGSPNQYDGDDFDWRRYHLEYSQQIRELETLNTLRMTHDQWTMRDGSLDLAWGLPLHPNHKVLYETIYSLSPHSVLEAGCGGGDHLHNLSLLLPDADIRGIDRSEGQLSVLRRRNPDLADRTSVVDLSLPHPITLRQADVVFTQAVLMHIQTGNGHRVALWNLFSLATNQVVLMENLDRHDLIRDIVGLWERRVLPWPRVVIYQANAGGGPAPIVASRLQINSDLPEIRVLE